MKFLQTHDTVLVKSVVEFLALHCD